MNCPLETREDAQLLLDFCARKLEPETAAALQRHVAVCSGCREFVRNQRAVWEALDAWEAAPVSPDFDSRLYQRIDSQGSWWDVLLRPFQPLRHVTLRRSLPAVAMAGLLLIAAITLELPLERPAVSTAPAANDMAQVDSVQPEQVVRTLDAMEMLNEFSYHVRADIPNSKL